MSYKKINFKLYFAAVLLLASPAYFTRAQIIANNSDIEAESNNFSPSIVQLSQTTEKISLNKDGVTLELPKVTKEIVPQNWSSANFLTPSFEQEEIAQRNEREEMKELAKKLGINIRNPKHLSLYREAAGWIGTRYKWAGNTKKGTDCSGLTGKILKDVYNKDIDRSSYIIADNLKEELNTENLLPGDLVFFNTLRKKRITHVGVYLGEGHFIHASRKGVIVSHLKEEYYARTLKKAGRI